MSVSAIVLLCVMIGKRRRNEKSQTQTGLGRCNELNSHFPLSLSLQRFSRWYKIYKCLSINTKNKFQRNFSCGVLAAMARRFLWLIKIFPTFKLLTRLVCHCWTWMRYAMMQCGATPPSIASTPQVKNSCFFRCILSMTSHKASSSCSRSSICDMRRSRLKTNYVHVERRPRAC